MLRRNSKVQTTGPARPFWWSSIGWTMNQINSQETFLTISSAYGTGYLTLGVASPGEWSITWEKSTEMVQSEGQLVFSDYNLWRAFGFMDTPELSDDDEKLRAGYKASDISSGHFIRFNEFACIPGPTSLQEPFTDWLSIYLTQEVRQAVSELYCRHRS